MKTRAYAGGATALLAALLIASCAVYVQTPTSTASDVPMPGRQANPDVTTIVPAVQVQTAAENAGALAPICEAAASCAALNAEQIMLQCVKKVPYTNVLVPQGTTFEVIDQSGEFSCIDSGTVVHDKEVLTCHGKQLYSFQLKLSNRSCVGTLLRSTGQCGAGYGYDAAQKCCAPLSGDASGSTIVTIDLGACP